MTKTIRETCRRIYELRNTHAAMDDFEQRLAERERLCIVLGFHKRDCQDAQCWCKKEFREFREGMKG